MFTMTLRRRSPYIAAALVAALGLLLAPLAFAAPINTQLSGSEEVPPVSTETSGEFSIEFNDDADRAEYSLDVFDGEDITAAHLHCAEEGENGPIVVTLYTSSSASGTDVDGLLAEAEIVDSEVEEAGEDCDDPITDVASLEDAIEDGIVYVNVHNVEHPAGLIRGQLQATSTDDDNGTTTDDGTDDDNGTTTDDGTDDDDDNGDNGDDQNGTDDDEDDNGDDNGTTTDDGLDGDDVLSSLDRLSVLYGRLLDLYSRLFSFEF